MYTLIAIPSTSACVGRPSKASRVRLSSLFYFEIEPLSITLSISLTSYFPCLRNGLDVLIPGSSVSTGNTVGGKKKGRAKIYETCALNFLNIVLQKYYSSNT